MTTIVATRTAMYADSRVTDGYTAYRTKKIVRVPGVGLAGTAGDSRFGEMFLKLLQSDEKREAFDDAEFFKDENERSFDALVVTEAGEIRHYCNSFIYYTVVDDDCYAIGSGGRCALLLVRLFGFDPEKAINAVIESGIDVNTGPPVVKMELL